MSALDMMRKTQQSKPSPMEAMLLKMLEGVGLDAKALEKVMTDVQTTVLFFKAEAAEIRKENAAILAKQDEILSLLKGRSNDGQNHYGN
jgi:hypothetical protein